MKKIISRKGVIVSIVLILVILVVLAVLIKVVLVDREASRYDGRPIALTIGGEPEEYVTEDQRLKFTTGVFERPTEELDHTYVVWTEVEWLEQFKTSVEENLVLHDLAIFDSSYHESAEVCETFICRDCGKTTASTRTVNAEDPYKDELDLLYEGGGVNIRFTPIRKMECRHCGGKTDKESLTAALQYGVIIDQPTQNVFMPIYVHQFFGEKGISLNFKNVMEPRVDMLGLRAADIYYAPTYLVRP